MAKKPFHKIKDDLPNRWRLQVIDFAPKRGTFYQDDIKSTFYTTKQITLNPIVSYYRTEQGVVRESTVIISEDCDHDYHDVNHFCKLANEKLDDKTGSHPEKKEIFSNGCTHH